MDARDLMQLAAKDPNGLALLVEKGRGGFEAVEWLMVCEIAGQSLPTSKIQGPLVRQLQKTTNVEEFDAVMAGLSYHIDSTGLAILQRLADKSPNAAIRSCAMGVIEQNQFNEEATDDEPEEDAIVFD